MQITHEQSENTKFPAAQQTFRRAFTRCGKRDIVFAGFFLFAVIVGGSV